MGRKVRWLDAVHRILTPSSQPDHEEKEDKAGRSTDKSNFKKLWHFSKSNSSSNAASASAAPAETASVPAPASREQQTPPRDQQPTEDFRDAESTETTSEQDDYGYPAAAIASSVAAKVGAVAALTAAAVTGANIAATPRAPARSKEELAAIKIQTACRGYLARRAYQARGHARLMSMLEGIAVRRQIKEALCCMRVMTRVQTHIYSRRVKTEEDKKALKTQTQIQVKVQGPDKTKIGEGWDDSQQSKEQLEGMMAMKQDAASRRQKALSYAFCNQWRNRNRSSGRAKTAPTHPPMFMDPGCPNWGWSWTERWMAAVRPWESQTTPDKDKGVAINSAGRSGKPRVSISVQIPTTPGRSVRPPSWPSPRSPSVLARTPSVPAPSPRSSLLHRSATDLRAGTTSPRSDQRPAWSSSSSPRPRSSQERPGSSSSSSSPRPRSSQERPAGSNSSSPRPRSSQERLAGSNSSSPRPRSSQERQGNSSPLHGGKEPSLRRTGSPRSGEQPRRLTLGGAASPRDEDASESTGAPVTPRYLQPTKSLRAKTRCTSPSAVENVDFPEGSTPRVPTPSSKKQLSLEFTDRANVSSPSTARSERARRHSRPPSPRI